MTGLPFDPLHPPAEPPPGCPMPTLWRIAYALHQLHRADGNRCACGARHPCTHRRAALRALVEACGVRLPVPRADIFDLWHGILLVSPPIRPHDPNR
ncbi:hypothetical protein GCM10022225_29690 [Plantactinospora mayteni]|uniref:SWIM-type domain-containing protein n=2 Tax=Plantactinospora mayteni TaxID=566021 RepID=A0ABQ4ESZ5_9ACTN|nr:hypothetical protein Pma05_43400 [Plantactinospora mayteni]